MSLKAATAAAKDIQPKKQTLNQCQSCCVELSLLFFAARYMWFARINVRGNVLTAPVRLMKSPRKGSIAATSVVMARYPPLTPILNAKFLISSALPLIPYLVSKYSYIGLANI